MINTHTYITKALSPQCENYFQVYLTRLIRSNLKDQLFALGDLQNHLETCVSSTCECKHLAESLDDVHRFNRFKAKTNTQRRVKESDGE